ncbi:MAG: nicotinate-nucleotide--dimethylbenzimidazole phosphoribosyltransferase [Ilumatobacteraceae bacterium]
MVDVAGLLSRVDGVLFDVGNTLVEQASPGTPVADLVAVPLRGAAEAVAALAGRVPIGVVSNTTVITAADLRRLLAPLGWTQHLDCIVATAELGIHKPSPEPLIAGAQQLGVPPQRCLYIGDAEIDRVAADAAGMQFCAAGPDLLRAIDRWTRGMTEIERSIAVPGVPDVDAGAQCERRLAALAKPPGSFGRLEPVLARLAAAQGRALPTVDPAAAVVFVGDHGHADDDYVTPWPRAISRQVAGLLADGRAAGSAFAAAAAVHLEVVDVGIATGATPPGVRHERVADGTANLRVGPALDDRQARAALEAGAATAMRLVGGGTRALCVGEVGIGNTTVASIIACWATGLDADDATGPGAGVPPDALARKREVVRVVAGSLDGVSDPVAVLCRVGGLEVAAMAGSMLACASLHVPVIVDGVTALAAAAIARAIEPSVAQFLVASHSSAEPASAALLELLGLDPILDLGLHVGESTGALLCVPILRAACAALASMAVLDDLAD